MSKYVALEDAKDAVMNTEAVFAVGMAEPYQKTIDVMKALDNLTTIDIVRCEDCKHYCRGHLCQYFSRYGTIETKENDFCNHGERKESEAE